MKALLADNNITSEVINTHDHMLDAINISREVGLYVHQTDFEQATRIIKEAEVE